MDWGSAEQRSVEQIRRHELTNEEWGLIRDLFPPPKNWRGRPRHPRLLLDGMFWLLRTGAPWRDLPERYGPWKTVWRRFHEWRASGRLSAVRLALLAQLDAQGQLDWDLWCVDGTSVRASRSAVGAGSSEPGEPLDHALGRSRGGFGTKIHLATDGTGIPLGAVITPGQAHESRSREETLNAVRIPQAGPGRPRRRPKALAADKAYSWRRIRRWLHAHKIEPVIPQRSNQVGKIGGHRRFDGTK